MNFSLEYSYIFSFLKACRIILLLNAGKYYTKNHGKNIRTMMVDVMKGHHLPGSPCGFSYYWRLNKERYPT